MLDASTVLIVVHVQNSFLPGGSAVPRGDEVVPLINGLAKRFADVVLTQDWHPEATSRKRKLVVCVFASFAEIL
jgi:nicotinamidase/pyrazinamidase